MCCGVLKGRWVGEVLFTTSEMDSSTKGADSYLLAFGWCGVSAP